MEMRSDPDFVRTDRAHTVIPCLDAPPEKHPMGAQPLPVNPGRALGDPDGAAATIARETRTPAAC